MADTDEQEAALEMQIEQAARALARLCRSRKIIIMEANCGAPSILTINVDLGKTWRWKLSEPVQPAYAILDVLGVTEEGEGE